MNLNIKLNDFKFIHPFTSIIAGATSSGKTEFTKLLIKNWKLLINIHTNILKVLWCFSETKSLFKNEFDNVEIEFNKGIPSLEVIERSKPHLIVIDDLMDEINQDVKNLFTKISHHHKISIIFIVQNLFNYNKYMRSISLNTEYFILMNGDRYIGQVENLGRQIFRSKNKDNFLDIFNKATNRPYGYLIIDLHPKRNKIITLRTRIFPEELSSSLLRKHSFSPIYYPIN